jgi:hypothetical protein
MVCFRLIVEGCLEGALRTGLFLLAAATIACTVWLGFLDKPKASLITAGLTFVLLIFAFLARFKRFKGFGIEGELWEQEMEQAAELRRGLTDLAEQVGASVSWQMGISNRWDAGTFNEKLAAIERTSSILERIGVTPVRIEQLKRPWHKCVMVDLARPIAERLRAKINENMEHVDAGIRAEKKRRLAERPRTEEMTPQEAILVEKYHSMSQTLSQADQMI